MRELLTDRVTVANPFDIHTYFWFDPPALGPRFRTVLRSGYDAVGFMLDCPPEGKADTAAFDAGDRCVHRGLARRSGRAPR